MTNVVEKVKIKPFVSCPVCQQDYDKDKHRPKCLICNNTTHSLCIVCIRTLINYGDGTFKCPICRYEHIPPPEGIDPNEHYIDNKDLLELNDLLQDQIRPKDESQVHRHMCEICKLYNAVSEAVAWCEECTKAFCKACGKTHDLMMKPIKRHPQLTPINEVDFSLIEKKDYCEEPNHNGEVIKFVCHEHEPAEYVCDVCVQGSHRNHNLKDLKTEAEKKKREIDDKFTEAIKRNKHDINRQRLLECAQGSLARNLSIVESKINKCQDHFIKMLQEHGVRRQCEFLDIKQEKTNLLIKETDETKQRCCSFENIANEIEQFHLLSQVTMMKDPKQLLQALDRYLNFDIEEAPTTNVYMEVKEFNGDRQLGDLLQSASHIITMPSQFQISYPKLAFRDHQFELVIQALSDNEICTAEGLPINIKVHCPCCDVHENLIPSNEKNGKYVVGYKPKSTGEYKFHIYIDGVVKEPMAVVSVHLLEVVYEKVVVGDEVCELKAFFKDEIDPNVVDMVKVECKDDVGNALEPVDEAVTSETLVATFQPSYLGKMKMYITFNGTIIAGPLTSAVCNKMSWDTDCMTDGEITHLAVHRDGSIYLADTMTNRKIISIKPKQEPIAVSNFQNVGTSFIAFDKAGNRFVLFKTVHNDASTETELHIYTPDGLRSYFLKSLKNPAGFAISPSGSVFAISDQEKYCIFLFHTPDFSENQMTISPFRTLGKEGKHWGLFNNPTTLCINSEDKIFVCDKGNGRVQELDMTGNPLNVYGPEILKLQAPEAICLSPEGHLLILDREKLVTINVTSCCRRTIHQVEINCKGQICNFNHLICCLSDCQVLRFCCGNNDMHIFRYVGRR